MQLEPEFLLNSTPIIPWYSLETGRKKKINDTEQKKGLNLFLNDTNIYFIIY